MRDMPQKYGQNPTFPTKIPWINSAFAKQIKYTKQLVCQKWRHFAARQYDTFSRVG